MPLLFNCLTKANKHIMPLASSSTSLKQHITKIHFTKTLWNHLALSFLYYTHTTRMSTNHVTYYTNEIDSNLVMRINSLISYFNSYFEHVQLWIVYFSRVMVYIVTNHTKSSCKNDMTACFTRQGHKLKRMGWFPIVLLYHLNSTIM